jgi:hypothetical protein
MTNFRALCAELIEIIEDHCNPDEYALPDVVNVLNRARALLAQPEPQGPTDEEIYDWHHRCADLTRVGEADHYWAFDLQHDEVAGVVRAALARWGRSAIDPVPQQEDVHYAWELHDAEGEWQAGGAANSLEDVQREGNRCLQTYSQDGPHKLIIERHCVTTIEPVPGVEGEP